MSLEIRSEIIKIGHEAIFEGFDMLIIFGESVPKDVEQYSIVHRVESPINKGFLNVGSKILIGNQEYTIEVIGDVAHETLEELSHATLYFGIEDREDLLPGSILLDPPIMPEIKTGDIIVFVK